jgi:hypothetical protein
MFRLLRVLALATILVVTASAKGMASPFDGLWVADLKTQMGQAGFDTYLVANGTYRCDSCRPPRTYPADGKMRVVPGDVSVVSESVAIVGPRTIVTRAVDHEMTRVTKMTVAPNGKTATYVALDEWPGRTKPLRTEYLAKRVAAAPHGAHAVSGSWLGLRYVAVPEEYRSVRLKEADGQFTRIDFRHGRYTATIGGQAAPVTGDGKGIFKARVSAPDSRTRIEVVSLNGKPLVERTYALSVDGRSMLTTVRDPADGSVYRTTSHRRS